MRALLVRNKGDVAIGYSVGRKQGLSLSIHLCALHGAQRWVNHSPSSQGAHSETSTCHQLLLFIALLNYESRFEVVRNCADFLILEISTIESPIPQALLTMWL